jgi:hypothetical protein
VELIAVREGTNVSRELVLRVKVRVCSVVKVKWMVVVVVTSTSVDEVTAVLLVEAVSECLPGGAGA